MRSSTSQSLLFRGIWGSAGASFVCGAWLHCRKEVFILKLSNEMQLSIMNKVKNGELTIEDALNQARKDREQLVQQKSLAEEEPPPVQYNFSVHKHGRYRWQKRVLQVILMDNFTTMRHGSLIDFKTKLLCSIEKGIVKRQLPFSIVKSCDDGVGSRFSISFKGHHDYELEATSLEEKHKMMQLVNQIIYRNIYSDSEGGNTESLTQPEVSRSLKEGVLLLHRGGLASFRWVKYEVQLHPGQLTLVPLKRRLPPDGEATSPSTVSMVIHLSDGDTRVRTPCSLDSFTLVTHKNEYNFKVPLSAPTAGEGSAQEQRDSWVKAIDKLCCDWKRRSLGEKKLLEMIPLRHLSIDEQLEDNNVNQESSNSLDSLSHHPQGDAGNMEEGCCKELLPPASPQSPGPSPTVSPGVGPSSPTSSVPPQSPGSFPFSPHQHPSSPIPELVTQEPDSLPGKLSPPDPPPLPPSIPLPPPLPLKVRTNRRKQRTKAFHWDEVRAEKISKSFWKHSSQKKIEIDTSLLLEQFAVKEMASFDVTESKNTQNIMLNDKIAHNFNIFLKSFPVQPGELKDKLLVVNEEDGGLSDEHITSLRRYVPTQEDVEMYKSYKGVVSELHIVDQYMMEMCHIPYLSTQLDLLLTLRELPVGMRDLQPLMNQKIRMCSQLLNSGAFVAVLEYLLAIGNYLNENAGKGKARGFRLTSLTKLSQLRGREKKFTLLHALVEQIMLHEPGLASFTQELAEFETVPGASIKGLTAEVDVLKNELQKVHQYKKTARKWNAGAAHTNFLKELKVAIDKYDMDLTALTKTCEEMKKLYSGVLLKFGESTEQESQGLFMCVCDFIQDFRRVQGHVC
ncbi:uncharacterized protein LOC128749102 isoform X3 [Synchiropus splendidus]|nr:uncharacterized protein LOC128749102 isoform X3 [Synchiropus splendidus]